MTRWFTASLLFESRHERESRAESLFEESLILIEAEDEEAARAAGVARGKADEVEFATSASDSVRWTFVRILAVHEIGPERPTSGSEVFSRFLSGAEAQSLSRKLDY